MVVVVVCACVVVVVVIDPSVVVVVVILIVVDDVVVVPPPLVVVVVVANPIGYVISLSHNSPKDLIVKNVASSETVINTQFNNSCFVKVDGLAPPISGII